ncbi:MAG: SDR family NAD(P)-dependent oxidoreductase [Gammaproteobacteria bacterium]|nr:SDR family NAD(P)-dependent oxidoreductase [Gammaproteobacteria bacterium]
MSSFTSIAVAQPVGSEYPSLAGRTVLITGSTDGLGRETALRLGALGAHVLVHGRNAERGAEVVEEINSGAGSAQFYAADLGSLADVRELAAAVREDHEQLHLLINNAGIGSGFADGARQTSADGYEMIFQVNYLSHYLLTDLLLPLLETSAPAQVINVASGAQRSVNFDDIMMERSFDSNAAYSQSKLAQILHTFHLATRYDAAELTFNTLHPATMMDTTLVRQMSSPARTTVDEGATALVNLAASPALIGRTGLYFNGLREARASSQAYDAAARQRLDTLSRELTGLPPETPL